MLFTVFGFYSSDNDDPNNYEFNPHPYGVVYGEQDAYFSYDQTFGSGTFIFHNDTFTKYSNFGGCVNGGSSVGVVNRKDAYYDGQNDLVLTIPDIGSGWERNDIEDHINEARGVVFDAKVIIRIIYITRTI